MSLQKKQVRSVFRESVFRRDRYRCRVCERKIHFGTSGRIEQEEMGIETILDLLDAHHVMPREDMPGGGYVKENGICLCKVPPNGKLIGEPVAQRSCHEKAEEWLKTGSGDVGYDPESLYRLIGSSLDLALLAAEKAKSV
jgi:hypothetical protein